MSLNSIRQLVQDDLTQVDALIVSELHSDVALINQLGHYIVSSGGKRLRPLLLVLSARACGYQGTEHQVLAAVIEFIHTATLLHDDVVDESDQRRGRDTANAIWGNAASVLVGDFLYSRAFQMMVRSQSLPILDILANTTNRIAEGEVLQLMNINEPDTSEAQYMEVIKYKTAQLFAAAAEIGAVLAEVTPEQRQAMNNFGMAMGNAFQLVDDILDYSADADELGKNIGDDLAEGKPTLPLIYVIQHGTPEQSALVKQAIAEGGLDQIAAIQAAIQDTGALDYCYQQAQKAVAQAQAELATLPQNAYTQALQQVVELAVNRSH